MSMLPRHALRSASQAWRSANATRPLASFTNYRTLFIPPSPSCTQPLRWRSASFHRRLASSTSSFAPAADQKAPAPASEESVPKSAGSAEEGSPDDRFSTAASEELLQAPGSSPSQPIGKIERRLSITFTCTVPDCGHRSSHEFSRLAYERGIVLCQCPACLTRHLIGLLNRFPPIVLMLIMLQPRSRSPWLVR